MANLVVSYAREDRPVVEELDRALGSLGYRVWYDSSVHGGEQWWDSILREIRACDALLAVVSGPSLTSVACERERQYALALGKPILPVATEPLTQAIPSDLAVRQIVDYSTHTTESAFALTAALVALPPPPPLPEPLPPPPPRPLSYMPELLAQVVRSETPTQTEQRRILDTLEPALRSSDTEEQRGAREVLRRFTSRSDLYADVERRALQLSAAPPQSTGGQLPRGGGPPQQPPQRAVLPSPPGPRVPAAGPPPRPVRKKRSIALVVFAAIGVLFVLLVGALVLFALADSGGGSCYWDPYGNYICP